MQAKDIEVGTRYAISRGWELGRGHSENYSAKCGEVIEKGVTSRQAYRGVVKGNRVSFIDTETGKPMINENGSSRTEVVPSREIRQEWAPYAEERRAALESQATLRAERLSQHSGDVSRIKSSLGVEDLFGKHLPPQVRTLEDTYRDGSYSREVRISVTKLADLLDLAFNAGAEHG